MTATEAITLPPDTTLLPTTPDHPRKYRISVTDAMVGAEVAQKPDLDLEQEVMLAIRAKVTGVTIHDGYKADVMTFRTEVLSVEALDDDPLPPAVPPAPEAPAAAPVKACRHLPAWVSGGLGAVIGLSISALWPLLG